MKQKPERPQGSPGAVELQRQYIQHVLEAVVAATAGVPPGLERLRAGLVAYWETCFAQRDLRKRILDAAAAGTGTRTEVDQIGLPFSLMLRSELEAAGRTDAELAAGAIYAQVRQIGIDEVAAGSVLPAARERLLAEVRAGIGPA